MNKEILNLDYQFIMGKLKPLVHVQVSKESMITDEYDANTKAFLSYVVELISTAKSIENASIELISKKISKLITDAKDVLENIIDNNLISDYYKNTLSTELTKISTSLTTISQTMTVEKIVDSISDALIQINNEVMVERNKEIDEAISLLKSEFIESFETELTNKSEEIEAAISKELDSQIKSKSDDVKKELSSALKVLLCKNIPIYVQNLNATFNKAFVQYIETNFSKNTNQLETANKLKRTYSAILVPFAMVAKLAKTTKDGIVSLGRAVKAKFGKPISSLMLRIKEGITKKLADVRLRFLKVTRIFRRPKRMLKIFLGRLKKKIDANDKLSALKKFGILGFLGKLIIDAIRKRNPRFALLSQMDFKPFKFLSVITNSVDDFIENLDKHVTIIQSNLHIFLDKNVVESYDAKKSGGILGFLGLKKSENGEDGSISGGGLFGFLGIIPTLISIFRKIWKFIKGIPKFFQRVWKFIKGAWGAIKRFWGLVKRLAKFGVDVLKGTAKIGTKATAKTATNTGAKIAQRGLGRAANKGLSHGNFITRRLVNIRRGYRGVLQNIHKKIEIIRGIPKQIQTVANIVRNIRSFKDIGKAVREAKAAFQLAKGAKAAASNPFTVAFAFALDGVFAAVEAQNDTYMAAIFDMNENEIGAQQRTAYTIAGTLAGNRSLFDANWSNPADVGMVAFETAMTVAKWTALGSLPIFVPPIGTAVGALIGLTVALLGTKRIAKAINWVCDIAKAAWNNFSKLFPILSKGLEYTWKAIAWTGKWIGKGLKYLWKGTKWLFKSLWNLNKWGYKKLWQGIKGLGNLIKKFGTFMIDCAKKALKKVKELATAAIKAVAKKIKDAIAKLGKVLMSNIFSFAKGVKRFFTGLKNIFFGEDEEVVELRARIRQVDQISTASYTSTLKERLKNYIILANDENANEEGATVDENAQSDIVDMIKFTAFINEMLNVPPKPLPIPVKEEQEKPSLASEAAVHWANS